MTLFSPFQTSLRVVGRQRVASHLYKHSTKQYKFFSSSENGDNPLILWLASNDDDKSITQESLQPLRILMPSNESKIIVSTPQQVVDAVDNHYSLSNDSQQFVGGMGESDAGVFFASQHQDPLVYYDLIQESIQTTKEFRHGVPFGAYTSGVNLPNDLPPLGYLGLSSIQVSLLASNPKEYSEATGLSTAEATKYFGQVCGFCVTVAETGFPLEVSVLQSFASSARDLAISLGAIHVHVYNDSE